MDFEKYYNKCLHFLSFRPRSEKELKEYLHKPSFVKKAKSPEKEEIENTITAIIEKLKEYRFLDDEQFATWWVEQRSKVKPKAKRIIAMELKQKGIEMDVIEEVLESEELPSEKEKVRKLAEKRILKYKDLPRQKIYEKMGRYLASKGFDWEIIRESIDDLIK